MNMDKWPLCGHFYSYVDPVRSLYYIGSRMGHVTMFCRGWIMDRAPYTKVSMRFFVKLWILVNGT